MRQVVLIVESNDHAEKFFKSCLARNGYYAIATDDANKALKLVRAWQPDLVMIDMHLADNATEWLIKSIKNAPDSSPRIVLTACDDLEKTSALDFAGRCRHPEAARLLADSRRYWRTVEQVRVYRCQR